jgi:branched-chain amino acid transport system substrate-binding protein
MMWTRTRCRSAAFVAFTGTVALLAAACGSSGGSSSNGGGGSAANASSNSPIIIGNEADLTGNATVGVPGSYGVKFAVDQINSHGGIDGHKLQLATEDSQGSAVGGIAAVRRLIEVDHAQAIVNTASSDATVPALPAAQSAQVPFVVSAASDPVIVTPSNTYVFMSPSVPVNVDVKEYVNYIKSKGYKSIALIATNAAFASAAVSLFKTQAPAAGIKLATVQTFAATDTDFSSQIHAAQASHADAVFVIGDFLGAVLKQAGDVGLNVPFMYDASTTDPLIIQSLGQEANGLVSFQTQATQLLDVLERAGRRAQPVHPRGLRGHVRAGRGDQAGAAARGAQRIEHQGGPGEHLRLRGRQDRLHLRGPHWLPGHVLRQQSRR